MYNNIISGSKSFLPTEWAELMYQPDSAIIDFYPSDFKIDLNGKKFAWQGVALLPFVDETRLLGALGTVYDTLDPRERRRNNPGQDRIFISSKHPWYETFKALYEYPDKTEYIELDPSKGKGTSGLIRPDDEANPAGSVVKSPVPALPEFVNEGAISAGYLNPQFAKGFVFPSKLLPNVTMPEKTLKPKDWNNKTPGGYRPYTGFQRARPMQGPNTVGNRMLGNMVRGQRHPQERPRYPPPGQRYPPPHQQPQRQPQRQPHRQQNRDNNHYNPYRR